MNSGTLFVVATPIGNLEDLSERARRTLAEADVIICEDTRVTRKLLDRYQIARPTVSVHQHSDPERLRALTLRIGQGENAAYVTDAGTPGISDPGNALVAAAVTAGFRVVPIPGPSALTALLSVAGLAVDRFTFLGFLPHKKGRETLFNEIKASAIPVVLFESPHRMLKTLQRLNELMPDARLVVGRELTKQFEEVLRGTPKEVLDALESNPLRQKGEFVLLVARGG